MTRHGGDVLVEMLTAYGVPAVFGLAGGQTLPLYDAIRSRAPRIRHVPMRDERHAAYAADGYARVSGRVGVCDATVGPGAIKLRRGWPRRSIRPSPSSRWSATCRAIGWRCVIAAAAINW